MADADTADTVDDAPAGAADAAAPGRGARIAAWRALRGRLIRLAASVIGGVLLYLSFPPVGWWWAAFPSLALLGWVLTRRQTTRAGGFGYGLLFGLAFYLPLIPWVGLFVGTGPWLALSLLQALFPALFGLLAVTVRGLPGWPLWFASEWAVQEWLKSSVPFGGFPWGVVAFGQAEGPLLPLAQLGGAPLVSVAVALVGFSLTALSLEIVMWWRRSHPSAEGSDAARPEAVLPGVIICVVLLATALVWPGVRQAGAGAGEHPSVTVAAVQGNVPRLGLDFNAQRRAVLDNHVAQTLKLAEDVRAGRAPQPMVVIWPENSSDIDPLRNTDAAAQISAAARAIRAPILVGTVLAAPGYTRDSPVATNTVLVWDPETGPQDRHDKRIIQPFGEYLPWRDFFRKFSSYADRAGYFLPGDGTGVVQAAGIPIGIATCWEVIFDRAVRDSVRGGAQLLAVPANNATFDAAMSAQQLAFARLRAVEHDRYVVVSGTTGISAVVAPDGYALATTEFFEPAYLDIAVRLKSNITFATDWGPTVQWVLVGLGVAAVIAAMLHNGKLVRRRRDSAVRAPVGPQRRASGQDSPEAGSEDEENSMSDLMAPSRRTLVIIPTYNERENLPLIVRRVHAAQPDVHILVVDDGSPDGTGGLADELSLADPDRIHVMHRVSKDGLGAAYLAGFAWGLSREYTVLVEMDADGSHAPEELGRLLSAVDGGADLAIGSRYVPGGTVRNWPWRRLALSRTANTYSRVLLGVGINDITAGYRAYRREVLEKIDLSAVDSKGYCFQIDLTWRAINAGFTVVEVPITFSERELGVSKMSGSNIREAMFKVAEWGMRGRLDRARGVSGRPASL